VRSVIEASYFREKVQICLRLAKRLPWNNPVRYQLLLMAEDFQKREKELETTAMQSRLRRDQGDQMPKRDLSEINFFRLKI
jgi:hypothetical protein